MNTQGWSRLVSTFSPIVNRWCHKSVTCESDVPGVVIEVFAGVARSIAGLEREKQEGGFRSWLAKITRNKIRDYFPHQAKQAEAEGGTEAFMRTHEQSESLASTICADAAESPIVRRVLEQVRAQFQAPNWQAFWMTVIDDKTTAEVGISVASVYQSQSRVLRRLRQKLSQLPQ